VGGGGVILRSDAADLSPAPDGPPTAAALLRAYPNPFNPRTTIFCRVPRAGLVSVQVFDVRGRLIARLADDHLPAGNHQFTWDGDTIGGRPAPSGVYLARLFLEGRALGEAAPLTLVK
jgi:hypothetical protein